MADALDETLGPDGFEAVEPALTSARRSWSALFTRGVAAAEDELGLEPGTGLDVLASMLRNGRRSRV